MDAPPQHDLPRTWGARFGWIVGGIVGALLGFAATYVIEVAVFRAHAADPIASAARVSTFLVGAGFLSGSLAGHAFGARGGMARYRALGISAGLLIAIVSWALLVVTRR